MEIKGQIQQNLNTEIIPKNQPKDFKEANTMPQKEGVVVVENTEQNKSLQDKNNNGVFVQEQNISFKEQLNQLNNQNGIYNFSFDTDFSAIYDFNVKESDEKDIKFFLDILEKNKNKQAIQSINLIPLVTNSTEITQNEDAQNIQATEKIMQIVETASKTGKPVRIDFDNQITVVLRVDNQGKINAHFYPGDKAAEEYLKNNMQTLRNTFDEKNILYSYLDYKQNKGNNGKERKEQK